MLIRTLGDDYVVWDEAAEIRFKKPGRGDRYATFTLSDAELTAIRTELDATDAIDRHYTVDVVDESGTVHATVRKTLYVSTDDSKAA